MFTRVTYAGLDESLEQRLRLAAGALAAHGIEARANAWDGTRCDAVIADPQDAYGRRVLDLARRRGTPTLELSSAAAVDPSTNVRGLTRTLYEMLGQNKKDSSAISVANSTTDAERSGLVRLATDKSLTGNDVEARLDNMVVWLLPRSGRVISATLSDQLRARERMTSSGWTFSPLPARQRTQTLGDVSASLDSFLIQAAWASREHLPTFPAKQVSLSDWPDLGGAAALVEPLAIAQALLRAPTNCREIARDQDLSESMVGACLWAFQAGNLLEDSALPVSATAARSTVPHAPAGLFARLAAHFGLARA